MKTTIKILMFFGVLFFAACADTDDMLTVIKPDGTCYREFTDDVSHHFITGDSVENNNPFPVEIDSTCEIRWRFRNSEWFTQYPVSKAMIDSVVKSNNSKDTVKPGVQKTPEMCFVVLRKNYASVEDMARNFKLKENHEWSKMKVKYSLDKKFRWFYTYYYYSETYPKLVTNFELPIENFMTKDEAQFWFTGQPNILKGMNGVEIREYVGKIEENFNKWYGQNMWNQEFKCLLSNYGQIKNKPVSVEKLESLRDTIFKTNVKDFDKIEMKDILNSYFKTDAFTVLWKGENSPMRKYEDSLDEQGYMTYFSKSFNYKLLLPGKVVQTENMVAQGDTIVWKLDAYRMALGDYTLEAQSRKTNVWAFILTGIIMLLSVGSFFWKAKK
ncbi:MAG TPA: hypothetical protein P5084_13060 [Paludibacter sp.]|nr:hypothetical protein [Paludibacter sp.]